jgi:hypothetical protein
MTSKNKAAKLRYLISIELELQTEHEKVIKCSLIVVDEILNDTNGFIQTSLHRSYWEEVKEILENKL